MKKRQKHWLLYIALLCILMLLNACEIKYPEERIIAVSQACYAIPGFSTGDPHNAQGKFMEKDSYGRILFAVDIYGRKAIGVCQKYDELYVYYYDNIGYLCIEGDSQLSEIQVEKLKNINDWEKELNNEKMIKREIHSSGLLPAINRSNIKNQELAKDIGEKNILKKFPNNYKLIVDFCDQSKTGQEIFMIWIYGEDEKGNEIKSTNRYYLMLLNKDGTYDPEKYLVELPNLIESNEPLAKIKEANNWVE